MKVYDIREYLIERDPRLVMSYPFMKSLDPVDFWTRLFEPQGEREGQRQRAGVTEWPYGLRIFMLAKNFLSVPDVFRDYIIRARRQEIYWRGDSQVMFERIVEETLAYRKLSEEEKIEYRKNALLLTGIKRLSSDVA